MGRPKGAKSNKYHYTCRNCLTEFYADEKPKQCPNCGCAEHHIYRGTIKSYNTCKYYMNQVDKLIPRMEAIMSQYYTLYKDYAWCQKLLITYVSRGIITKDQIPKLQNKFSKYTRKIPVVKPKDK